MKKTIVRRYSQALKQEVVREYEAGTSIYRLQQKYGIKGSLTIKKWIEKYSPLGIRTEIVHIQTAADQIEFKAMQKRIQELESALAESVLESRMLKATLEVASEALDMDLKKSFGKQSSQKSPKTKV